MFLLRVARYLLNAIVLKDEGRMCCSSHDFVFYHMFSKVNCPYQALCQCLPTWMFVGVHVHMQVSRSRWKVVNSSRLSFVLSGRRHDASSVALAIDKLCVAIAAAVPPRYVAGSTSMRRGRGRIRQDTRDSCYVDDLPQAPIQVRSFLNTNHAPKCCCAHTLKLLYITGSGVPMEQLPSL